MQKTLTKRAEDVATHLGSINHITVRSGERYTYIACLV